MMWIGQGTSHCAIVVRNRKVHQVRSGTCRDPTMLEYRNISFFVLNVKILHHLSHVNKYVFIFSLMCFILKCIQVYKYVDCVKFVERKQDASSHGN